MAPFGHIFAKYRSIFDFFYWHISRTICDKTVINCNHAPFAFTESKHFTKYDSKVRCALLDASKVFDDVLHNDSFKKLLDRNVGLSVVFVRLLRTWHSQLVCPVRWNSKLGESFVIQCGVRQGGVLSPYLFAVYIDDLVVNLRRSGFGTYIGQLFRGCFYTPMTLHHC